MTKSKYIYPAVISQDEDGFYVEFPDILNCFTDGDTLEQTLENAKDVLELMLYEMETKNVEPPTATKITDIKCNESSFVTLVLADTMMYRKKFKKSAVKKTLSIPEWLNVEAEKNEINFSAVLQQALKDQLKLN